MRAVHKAERPGRAESGKETRIGVASARILVEGNLKFLLPSGRSISKNHEVVVGPRPGGVRELPDGGDVGELDRKAGPPVRDQLEPSVGKLHEERRGRTRLRAFGAVHGRSRRRVLPIVPFCHGSEECRFSAIGVGRARAERASRVEAYPLVEEGATPPTSAPRGVEQEQFYRNAARGVNPAKPRKRRSHTFPQIGPQGARSAAYDRRKAGRGERRRREAPRAGLAKSRTGVVG